MARILQTYPSRARREGIEGTVAISLRVTPKGRGTDCLVTSSSGSELLDKGACRGVERYARFEPALDAAGRPTTGSFRTRISYQLPESVSQDEPKASIDPNTASPSLEVHSPGTPDAADDKMAMTARDAALYWLDSVAAQEHEDLRTPAAVEEEKVLTYEAAQKWLDHAAELTPAYISAQSSVGFRGFVDERELTDPMWAALNKGPLYDGYYLGGPSETEVEPIVKVQSRIQTGVPEYCIMLMQVQRIRGTNSPSKHVLEGIEESPYFAPGFALDQACKEKRPWPDGTKPGEVFEWDGRLAFRTQGGAAIADEGLSCQDYDDITKGVFVLSPYATFNTQFRTNVAPPIGSAIRKSAEIFSEASRHFISGIERGNTFGLKRVDLTFDPQVVGDTNDVWARFHVLDDDTNDQFCAVVRLEQNTSIFQRVSRIPKSDRKLPWDYQSSAEIWYRTPELLEFGQAIAPGFLAIASSEDHAADASGN